MILARVNTGSSVYDAFKKFKTQREFKRLKEATVDWLLYLMFPALVYDLQDAAVLLKLLLAS